MIAIRTSWLWLTVGRDFYRDRPVSVFLALFPRLGDTMPGEEVRCAFALELSAWFDRDHYWTRPRPGRYNSIAWTGREPGRWRVAAWRRCA